MRGPQTIATALVLASLAAPLAVSAELVRVIEFPVDGPATFYSDFNNSREGGARVHEGNDLMAAKMTPAVSAIDGRVRWITGSEASWGWSVTLEDAEGYTYHYFHLNNDTPGTDDGLGGRQYAIAVGIERDERVRKGQLIGWVGDSGNAESTAPHLHFEIHEPGGFAADPYPSLIAASRKGRYRPGDAMTASPTINADKGLMVDESAMIYCVSGSLIRSTTNPAVYYCGVDGKRYVFPNQKVYASWYKDFSGVQTVTDAEMAAIRLGGNVTYRPGVKLVKIQTDPKVYAVARGGVLRHVTTAALASRFYGSTWAKQVEDIPDAFFVNYTVGEPIITAD